MKTARPNRKQPRSEEVRDELLRFIQSQFYPDQPLAFTKDRPRLLQWVVWRLAVYLDSKAVSLPTDRYLAIMKDNILMPALQCGDTGNITYLPAYLGKVVESHLRIHGPEYYEEGKLQRDSAGTYLATALKIAQDGISSAERDPIREMAQAARLLKLKARKTPSTKPLDNGQLTML